MTNNIIYHSKNLTMHGTFVGVGAQILAYGTYTTSLTSIKVATIADGSKIKEIEQIDEITVISQTDDLDRSQDIPVHN